MTQEIAEGRLVERRVDTTPANEDFTGIVNPRDSARREGGWDPYEVWRTRVRAPSKNAKTQKDRDPRST